MCVCVVYVCRYLLICTCVCVCIHVCVHFSVCVSVTLCICLYIYRVCVSSIAMYVYMQEEVFVVHLSSIEALWLILYKPSILYYSLHIVLILIIVYMSLCTKYHDVTVTMTTTQVGGVQAVEGGSSVDYLVNYSCITDRYEIV